MKQILEPKPSTLNPQPCRLLVEMKQILEELPNVVEAVIEKVKSDHTSIESHSMKQRMEQIKNDIHPTCRPSALQLCEAAREIL
jgi:hypothetical protein